LHPASPLRSAPDIPQAVSRVKIGKAPRSPPSSRRRPSNLPQHFHAATGVYSLSHFIPAWLSGKGTLKALYVRHRRLGSYVAIGPIPSSLVCQGGHGGVHRAALLPESADFCLRMLNGSWAPRPHPGAESLGARRAGRREVSRVVRFVGVNGSAKKTRSETNGLPWWRHRQPVWGDFWRGGGPSTRLTGRTPRFGRICAPASGLKRPRLGLGASWQSRQGAVGTVQTLGHEVRISQKLWASRATDRLFCHKLDDRHFQRAECPRRDLP
jgi:hypothetical protein